MKQIKQIAGLRAQIKNWRQAGETIAFVPTMGNLHAGHLALVKRAQERGTKVIVSIFVNPTQFDRAEDLSAYPRTVEDDCAALQAMGTNAVFLPTPDVMYPSGGLATKVIVPGISELLEGEKRPGHFTGVSTVVAKLFNLVQPDIAVFGEKDFQQLMLIRQMVRELDIPVQIEGLPTVREDDGLALSSRNGYLSAEERSIAPRLQQNLQHMLTLIAAGERDYATLQTQTMQALADQGFTPEYIEIRRAVDLLAPEKNDDELVILASAWLGKARLIDNLPFSLKSLMKT